MVFDEIVTRRSVDTRQVLIDTRPIIQRAYAMYSWSLGNGGSPSPAKITDEATDLLRRNFDFLDRGRPFGSIRDEILQSARFATCPYCNARTVDSLDHALPIAVYPEYAILSQNLVPACSACNQSKGDECLEKTGKRLMHPYFVRIPQEPILFASLDISGQTVTWRFYLEKNDATNDSQFESIENLFNLLKLADLYYTISVGDILDRMEHVKQLRKTGGATDVRRYFEMEAESARRNRGENYWKTAILRALGKSDDFCAGGHQLLP